MVARIIEACARNRLFVLLGVARTRVVEYLAAIQVTLPDGVSPRLGPDATGVGWAFQCALVDRSGRHGLDELRTFQDFTLRYALSSVPGVAEVASVGGYQKQYQVTVDPNRLRAHDVSLQEVIAAIRDSSDDVGGAAARALRPGVLRARPRLRGGPVRARARRGEGPRARRRPGAGARPRHGPLGLWALDYRLSTAVWVGIIALVGLAAQTGIVMIVYIDNAYARRKRAGLVRNLDDIIWAHMEGTVLRVRPKLMTVATMLFGLLPLLWASGSGADVMKRIAAPMMGGLLTSAFLTLEIIPVVYTYWRQEQLLWERLAPLDPRRLARLRALATVQNAGWAALAAVLASTPYVAWPTWALAAAAVIVTGAGGYLAARPAARLLVWPEDGERERSATAAA